MQQRVSTISGEYPSMRDGHNKCSFLWLDSKRLGDRAEGLWRIHDELYDLTDFVDQHPGGESWIRFTRGTDITEAFEIHHLTTLPVQMLKKYWVRKAAQPRLYRFTFNEDGFYKTLRKKVLERMKTMDTSKASTTKTILDTLLALTFALAIASAALNSVKLSIVTGVVMCWAIIASHNFFHQRDNWRMKVFNLGLLTYIEWRISHSMSHHLYTNTLYDLEMSLWEPLYVWVPHPDAKNFMQRYLSWVYGVLLKPTMFIHAFIKRIVLGLVFYRNEIRLDDFIPFTVPLAMALLTPASALVVLKQWSIIMTMASFCFAFIATNAGHHHDETVHDGDKLNDDMDWGLYQLDVVMDRSDIKGSLFWELTHFGNHALHHFFPTVDHALLEQFSDLFYETCREFETHLVEKPWFFHILGQHRQMTRVHPHTETRVVRTKHLME